MVAGGGEAAGGRGRGGDGGRGDGRGGEGRGGDGLGAAAEGGCGAGRMGQPALTEQVPEVHPVTLLVKPVREALIRFPAWLHPHFGERA